MEKHQSSFADNNVQDSLCKNGHFPVTSDVATLDLRRLQTPYSITGLLGPNESQAGSGHHASQDGINQTLSGRFQGIVEFGFSWSILWLSKKKQLSLVVIIFCYGPWIIV